MLPLLTLAGMRGFVDGNIPDEAIEEVGAMMKQVLDIVDVFTGIDSILVEGCVFGFDGNRWDDNRSELPDAENVAVKVEFENFTPFALLQYMTSNVRGKLPGSTI